MIIQVIAAFAAIFTFAMALEIPKKYLINCAFIGAAGMVCLSGCTAKIRDDDS